MWSCFIVLFMNIYLKNDKGNSMTRAIVLVIDSFGIGYSADAEEFADVGANTLANLAKAYYTETGKAINLPNLASLG